MKTLRGDVVLVLFPNSDLRTAKRRPALVLQRDYLGSGVVVVREVDATICSQCGEEWIDDATARQLEQIVNDARARRLQVEIAALK
jgi:YgiT-type zinc finger domain-containing protein